MSEDKISLIEVMNTWQGEGPDSGRQMLITRFKYCNMHCSFCDTWIKMKTAIEGHYTTDDINKALKKTKALMITGGEPTFNSEKNLNLNQTMKMLEECDFELANIETNGYAIYQLIHRMLILPQYVQDRIKIMYSPKFFNSEQLEQQLEKVALNINIPNIYLKIVCDGREMTDKFIKEVSALTENKGKIYLMPEGITKDELIKSLPHTIDMADEYNCNVSSRLHIMNEFI